MLQVYTAETTDTHRTLLASAPTWRELVRRLALSDRLVASDLNRKLELMPDSDMAVLVTVTREQAESILEEARR